MAIRFKAIPVKQETFDYKEQAKEVYRSENPHDDRQVTDDFITKRAFLYYIHGGRLP